MKALKRDTRLNLTHNPTGELADILYRWYRVSKLKNKRKRLHGFNSRTTTK